MARDKKAKIRQVEPDPKYSSRQVAKLINRVMRDGQKSVAASLVYRALDVVKQKSEQEPLAALEQAIKQITPQMEVRSRRVGGAAYQVPVPVRGLRGSSLAVRWLVIEAGKRPNKDYKSFADKLAAEITDAVKGTGGAVQKKLTFHKMAEANKAFSHFRW
ncbi:MAG: 30S ribosomal protein S7 [Candidatus Chisholmbacteria bacterium RIFCSPHIGHO2_01_FULL_48_12]|uniref:Small ribosomal subunit protein uS7 n=1 Tax=Candidatus Chisholmbacteria bacterium RIFCSPHIGHO2_01_FULL_48_12 TaxID=1797589 RepID=A0A1G1VKD7_9BACT|nr:MAG: 30S ribosomal protein S7 [Candidatus Chisholmbacteria bacterium RIFCSPHIGHO2_01_FULL_48_12]